MARRRKENDGSHPPDTLREMMQPLEEKTDAALKQARRLNEALRESNLHAVETHKAWLKRALRELVDELKPFPEGEQPLKVYLTLYPAKNLRKELKKLPEHIYEELNREFSFPVSVPEHIAALIARLFGRG